MGGHPERKIGQRPERGKVGGHQRRTVGVDARKHAVAVGGGTAMPWNMLEHRQDAAGLQAIRDRARNRRDLVGGISVSTVANHRVCTADRHVGDRKTIDIDTDRLEIGGNQAGAETGGGEPCGGVPIVDAAVGGARRIGRPMRRAQALHAAALLIDEHSGIAPNRVAKRCSQPGHLRRRLDVALEDDQPPRRARAHERPLRGRQHCARNPGDESAYRHGRGRSAQLSYWERRIARQQLCRSRRIGSPHGRTQTAQSSCGRTRPCCPNPLAE